jgi:hypothetical protein
MIAEFHCWWPGRREDEELKFYLVGDTAEAIAWSLVETFHDAVIDHDATWRDRRGGYRPYAARPARSFHLDVASAEAYDAHRFDDAWWEKQAWRVADALSEGSLAKMPIADFRWLFPPDTLLTMYLAELVGTYYAGHHGVPQGGLDAKRAIAYFEQARYLRWLKLEEVGA